MVLREARNALDDVKTHLALFGRTVACIAARLGFHASLGRIVPKTLYHKPVTLQSLNPKLQSPES